MTEDFSMHALSNFILTTYSTVLSVCMHSTFCLYACYMEEPPTGLLTWMCTPKINIIASCQQSVYTESKICVYSQKPSALK